MMVMNLITIHRLMLGMNTTTTTIMSTILGTNPAARISRR